MEISVWGEGQHPRERRPWGGAGPWRAIITQVRVA